MSGYITQRPLRDYERYPKADEIRVFENIPARTNTGVGFLNCNNSYHSTVPWDGTKPRRFMYMSLNKRYSNLYEIQVIPGWVMSHAKGSSPQYKLEFQAKHIRASECLEVQWG